MNFTTSLIKEILNEPSILIGIITAIGLISLKKNITEIVSGTFNSILGFIILGAGAELLISSLHKLGFIIRDGFHVQGVIPSNEAIVAIAQKTFGKETTLIMGLGFLFNLIFARFTPLKYIFLTSHHTFFMAVLLSVVLGTLGLKDFYLIFLGSIILGALMVLMPALAQPFMKKITQNDQIALGHFGTLGYITSGYIAKFTGNLKNNTEDININKNLSFLRDSILSTGLIFIAIFLIVCFSVGPKTVLKYSDGKSIFIFSILEGLKFAAGISIILMGVRMILEKIVLAFKGISEKLVPNAKPALDCPIIFPYAPNAVLIGFLSSFIGGLISMFFLANINLAVIIPGLIPHFFTGATAGIFGNISGGKRGAIIGAFVNGILITILPALLLSSLGQLGFENTTFGDSDFALVGLILTYIAKFVN